jgi:hypothetical protein
MNKYLLRKTGFSVFLILSAVISSSFIALQTKGDSENWLKGIWQGVGVQVDSPNQVHSWTMVFYANPEKDSYVIQYPSIPCKGTWKLVKMEKNRAEFIETVEEKDKCMDNGYVIVTYVNRKHISFSWFREKNSKVMAYCTLSKID